MVLKKFSFGGLFLVLLSVILGIFIINLVVADSPSASGCPSPKVLLNPSSGDAPLTVTITSDATDFINCINDLFGSPEPEESYADHRISFYDGNTVNLILNGYHTASVNYNFNNPGTYSISSSVTYTIHTHDQHDFYDTGSKSITLGPVAPTAPTMNVSISGPSNVNLGDPYVHTGSFTWTNAEHVTMKLSWYNPEGNEEGYFQATSNEPDDSGELNVAGFGAYAGVWKVCAEGTATSGNLEDNDEQCKDVVVEEEIGPPPVIEVTSPSGGESWQIGTQKEITWDAPGIDNVRIQLTTNNGGSWDDIEANTANDGSHSWIVSGDPTGSAKIRISDVSDETVKDDSGLFSLTSSGGGGTEPPPGTPACAFTVSRWSSSSDGSGSISGDDVEEGQTVYLVAEGSNCNGQSVSFLIGETDSPGSGSWAGRDQTDTDKLNVDEDSTTFSNNIAIASWVTEWHLDENSISDDPEYVFRAELISNPSTAIDDGSGKITINQAEGGGGLQCSQIITCESYTDETSCNSDSNTCNVAEDTIDENVNCDDSDIDCRCEWTEASECKLIYEGFNEGSAVGKCVYTQETSDDCEDGLLTFSWTAQWIWDELNPEQNDPENLANQCNNGEKVVECPAQIPLPFFGTYNLIITIVVILLLYWAWSMNEGKRRVRKKKK